MKWAEGKKILILEREGCWMEVVLVLLVVSSLLGLSNSFYTQKVHSDLSTQSAFNKPHWQPNFRLHFHNIRKKATCTQLFFTWTQITLFRSSSCFTLQCNSITKVRTTLLSEWMTKTLFGVVTLWNHKLNFYKRENLLTCSIDQVPSNSWKSPLTILNSMSRLWHKGKSSRSPS